MLVIFDSLPLSSKPAVASEAVAEDASGFVPTLCNPSSPCFEQGTIKSHLPLSPQPGPPSQVNSSLGEVVSNQSTSSRSLPDTSQISSQHLDLLLASGGVDSGCGRRATDSGLTLGMKKVHFETAAGEQTPLQIPFGVQRFDLQSIRLYKKILTIHTEVCSLHMLCLNSATTAAKQSPEL